MLFEWTYKILLYVFAGLACYAAISDWQRFRIPNIVPICLIALWPVYMTVSPAPVDWGYSLLFAAIVLALGFAAFAGNFVGAGDVKFLAAAMLWVPPVQAADFLVAVGLSGGVLCLVLMRAHSFGLIKSPDVATSPQMATIASKSPYYKQCAPYGIAIACGCLVTACQLLVNP